MFELKVISFFSGAHYLREYKGKCEAVHGHNWKVEVIAQRAKLNDQGLALDFKELEGMLDSVLDKLDHKNLNDIDFFKDHNPSSEYIAYFIYQELKGPVKEKGLKLKEVVAWEQRDSAASYRE
jgi:6-pyruvoyltetrahydropterin/6-carboxytetrahydropterin synthase